MGKLKKEDEDEDEEEEKGDDDDDDDVPLLSSLPIRKSQQSVSNYLEY